MFDGSYNSLVWMYIALMLNGKDPFKKINKIDE